MIVKIEEGGKIAVPLAFLKELLLGEGREAEVTLCNREIVIKRVTKGCIFCDAGARLVRMGDIFVCRSCIERLQKAKDGEFLFNVWQG